LPSTNPRKQTERSGYLGAGCGESRTPRFEGEVPWVIPGIDSNEVRSQTIALTKGVRLMSMS
ncbi:hypothetical protein, partial [Moorena sp. SIO3B2]|uniref:hypothetical protein n=1 Tax=Moorena sp. SIO3B2 TaxID=2607827 RepID=UPI00338DB041